MGLRQEIGDAGELEVVAKVACPNCGKRLMALPKNYPLYDVQCTACSFRAQVKTASSPPRDTVFGAGWEIMSKVLKSGFLVPPTIVNFKWAEKGAGRQEIRFYPFVPRENLRNYRLSPTARRANYKMFSYQGLLVLPHFVLYRNGANSAGSAAPRRPRRADNRDSKGG